jgi:hypothetical protein
MSLITTFWQKGERFKAYFSRWETAMLRLQSTTTKIIEDHAIVRSLLNDVIGNDDLSRDLDMAALGKADINTVTTAIRKHEMDVINTATLVSLHEEPINALSSFESDTYTDPYHHEHACLTDNTEDDGMFHEQACLGDNTECDNMFPPPQAVLPPPK